jgi:hypothetical protein
LRIHNFFFFEIIRNPNPINIQVRFATLTKEFGELLTKFGECKPNVYIYKKKYFFYSIILSLLSINKSLRKNTYINGIVEMNNENKECDIGALKKWIVKTK